jgi:hypothetical protein
MVPIPVATCSFVCRVELRHESVAGICVPPQMVGELPEGLEKVYNLDDTPIPFCAIPSALCCSTLIYSTLLYATHISFLFYSTLLYFASLCSALRCSALIYSTLLR